MRPQIEIIIINSIHPKWNILTYRKIRKLKELIRTHSPFRANILEFGFIRAESAVIGRLKGWFGMLISTITTLFCGAVSRTHINLSDSIVTFVKVMNCGLIPMLVSCNHHKTQSENMNSSETSSNESNHKILTTQSLDLRSKVNEIIKSSSAVIDSASASRQSIIKPNWIVSPDWIVKAARNWIKVRN